MSLTYGFYNALDHDRLYNARQMSQIFDGLVNDGIYMAIGEAMMVKARDYMNLQIGTGRAWFNHTWTYNDSRYLITLDSADSVVSRIDAICLRIDTRVTHRQNSFEVIKGTPSTNPSKPNIATGDNEVFRYPLAYVTVRAGATAINQGNIENMVGTSATPFVTGIVKTLSIDDIVDAWRYQWQAWLQARYAEVNSYIAQETSEIEAEHTAFTNFVSGQRSGITSEHSTLTNFIASERTAMSNEHLNYTSFISGEEAEMTAEHADFTSFISNEESVMSGEHSVLTQFIADERSDISSEHSDLTQFIADERSDISSEHSILTQFITDERSEISSEHAAYTAWMDGKEDEFTDWFEAIRGQLDEDAAGHLQNEIDDINAGWDDVVEEVTSQVNAKIEELEGAVEAEIAESAAQLFNYYYELENKTTVINDGVITETNDKAVAVTTFTDVTDGKNIETTITPFEGDYNYIKMAQIRSSDGGKTITESYTRVAKEG